MCAKQKQKKSILLRLLVLGVSVYMVVTLAGLWNTLNDKLLIKQKLEKKYTDEQTEVEELKQLLDQGSQAELIEKAARERLGYVYPDEQIFVDISGN